jgi:4-amino-4-deoxy-L-arabinose transferase-like glycosyltransferase
VSHRARAIARVPRAAWICGLVACLNAVCWSFVTPAFQVPDEPDHYAYVKQLFETRSLPSSGAEPTSREIVDTLVGLRYPQMREQPQNTAIVSAAEESELQRDVALADQGNEAGSAAAGVATNEPPLYYAIEAIPFGLAKGGSALDRLALMRLASALFAGLTAMFAFLFVRETLPGARWAWIVGGLAVALTPLLGFMSGAVNPDAMLFSVSAAIFYCLARAFRRGFDTAAAIAIGTLTAVGFLTKLNFIGLAPGILLGLVVLAVRGARSSGRAAYLRLALSLAIALSPVLLYTAINALSGHRTLGVVSAATHYLHGSIPAQLNYIWQLYLPRLPGTVNDFPGLFPAQQLWFKGYVGLYGWLDTPFPGWVDHLALIPAAAIALLCGRGLFASRATLRSRASELGVYALIALGLLALIGADSYLAYPRIVAEYAQVRYLLPLLPLFGAAVALAARGAGRRWGPIVGALIVVLLLAHDIFSQLLVVGRYYA